MLLEININNYAIIDQLSLSLGEGFNVLTGETGAGKSILIGALGLLLGGRADADAVRAGADRTRIEGVFDLSEATREALNADLSEFGIELDAGETLILSREVMAAGRSVARINGRAVSAKVLQSIGHHLVDVHGQSDNAALKREREHLGLLDRWAGGAEDRVRLSELVQKQRTLRRELKSLNRDADELEERSQRLSFALEDIEAAQISPGEEAQLKADANRQANSEKIARLADQAYAALSGDDEDSVLAGIDQVDRAAGDIGELGRIDESMLEVAEQATASLEALRELAERIRDYRDSLEFSPEHLEALEERLAMISELCRKYRCVDSTALLDYSAKAAAELASIEGSDARIEELQAKDAAIRKEIGELCKRIHLRRKDAAGLLAEAVEKELGSLGMQGGHFHCAFEALPAGPNEGVQIDAKGFDPKATYSFDESGVDQMRFMVSLNPGEPPRPLARVASGGETARLMLAIKQILSASDEVQTLIFDEIDAGIGGRIGAVVGQKTLAPSPRSSGALRHPPPAGCVPRRLALPSAKGHFGRPAPPPPFNP